ncbi:HD domain-containing protein [Streptacidiphilus melanogenes]|uniref:HD domain-containing protein n=1 Tax=Streptacidiphilus melanogenes TaxID=411235 RepID=UPI0005A92556|nr:HD domain-containing protein [Streptacidiphilus melanogenes]
MNWNGWAARLAEQHLSEPLPRRWEHSRGVGRKAESIADRFGADGPLLVDAAWLHDIGYAPTVASTGFHPLDGALFLRDVVGVDDRVCSLVAYHSSAAAEAARRGLSERLSTEFAPVAGLLADALTYCDMTTSPDGEPIAVEERLAEILARYGPDSLITAAITEARPEILRAVDTVRSLPRRDQPR